MNHYEIKPYKFKISREIGNCHMNTLLQAKDIISLRDTTREQIELIFETADSYWPIISSRTKSNVLRDKILATLFFQPSTRTRLSFESAMQRLGGSVIGFASADVSRAGDAYGETLEDTAKMVEKYADIAVIRHHQAGAALQFSQACKIPVVNAGDGDNEHPTQALLDLYTIRHERGKIDGSTILMMGDLNFRAVHSLGFSLSKFNDVKLYLCSSEDQKLPTYYCQEFRELGLNFEVTEKMEDVIEELDMIYVLASTRDRSKLPTSYEYRLEPERLTKAKDDVIILHQLPRLDELPVTIDEMKQSKYLTIEPLCGVAVRMAVLSLLLNKVGGNL